MQYHALSCNTLKYCVVPCNTTQYHGVDHLQPGETNSAELLSQELQSAASSLEGILLFAPFVADYIKEDRNDQLFEEDHGARRNQRKIRRQQRSDKEKGNIKMKNTPSRQANFDFVNKTRNKPKSTNEDSITKKFETP